jgi:hypothetical protein
MGVDGSGSAELAVSVRGKVSITTLNYVLSRLKLIVLVFSQFTGVTLIPSLDLL